MIDPRLTPLVACVQIMVPPNVAGKVKSIVPKGIYTLDDTIMVLEDPSNSANTLPLRLSHYWPVRNPRPVQEKLAPNQPLLTGQRVLDSLFPSVLGGTCAIPGAFGCGKVSGGWRAHSAHRISGLQFCVLTFLLRIVCFSALIRL